MTCAVPPGTRTLRAFVRLLCQTLEERAPGIGLSFGTAFAQAQRSVNPISTLARWLAGHVRGSGTTLAISGLDVALPFREDAVQLLAALARAGDTAITVDVDSTDGLPLALWLAEGLAQVAVEPATEDANETSPARDFRVAGVDVSDHLVAATERADREQIRALLRDHGFDLVDLGSADLVDEALDVLGPRIADPQLSALHALREGRRGRMDTAEAWFRDALAGAQSEELRARIAERFASVFIRNRRPDIIELLGPFVDAGYLPPADRAAILALIAEHQVQNHERDSAAATLERALALGEHAGDALRRFRLAARAAFVWLNLGEEERAWRYAEAVVLDGGRAGFDDLAASAASVLHVLAYRRGGPVAALEHLYAGALHAVRSGNSAFHLYFLCAAFELEVERGNDDAIEHLQNELASYDVHYGELTAMDSLVPARAQMAAWRGDFRVAHDLLSASFPHEGSIDATGLRSAEVALYGAGAGLADAARRALARYELARRTPAREDDGRGSLRSAVYASLARRLLQEPVVPLDVKPANPRDMALERAAAIVDAPQRLDHAGFWEALEALHALDYGGIARIFARLPERFA